MKNKVTRKSILLSSLILLVLGLILAIFPNNIMRFFDYIVGVALAVIGLINIAVYFKNRKIDNNILSLIFGVLIIALGVYFILTPGLVVKIASILFGLSIIFNGIVSLQLAMDAKKFNTGKWGIILLFAIINIIFGAILLFYPFASILILIMYTGIFMTISAIFNLLSLLIHKEPKYEN